MTTKFSVGRSLVFVGLGIALLAVVWSSARMSRKMQSSAESVDQTAFVQLVPGNQSKVVIEVDTAKSGRIEGHLLETAGKNAYTRTSTLVTVSFGGDVKIVMGKTSDVRAGAVLHVSGRLTQDRAIMAQQLVILTGYVDVK